METTLTTSKRNALTPIQATALEMRTDPVRFPRIASLNREDSIKAMVDVVLSAAIYRGVHIEASDAAATAAALVDEILADRRWGLPYISFAEIRRAVRNACLETDMYGVNVASIYRAIVNYAKGEGQSAREQAQLLARRSATPSSPQIAIDAAAAELARNSQK